ncbi:hypothetical protein [Pontibacillus salipaludis]|uniref:Uncharacterized protein n=1 Tax=Pontibacillus salipaludis TaxID=1697394 RepID=A0ABQ1PR84_9BACI|nr:hypothetical protein [Pontibacillus salipaludis]GGD01442.1 hypothetical protein GCM10011389_05970 [Pontibacillus salipaludis]
MWRTGSSSGGMAQVKSTTAQKFFRTAQVQKITTQDEPSQLKSSHIGSNTEVMAQVNRKPAQAIALDYPQYKRISGSGTSITVQYSLSCVHP